MIAVTAEVLYIFDILMRIHAVTVLLLFNLEKVCFVLYIVSQMTVEGSDGELHPAVDGQRLSEVNILLFTVSACAFKMDLHRFLSCVLTHCSNHLFYLSFSTQSL